MIARPCHEVDAVERCENYLEEVHPTLEMNMWLEYPTIVSIGRILDYYC